MRSLSTRAGYGIATIDRLRGDTAIRGPVKATSPTGAHGAPPTSVPSRNRDRVDRLCASFRKQQCR
jgi:hypothetical protein